MGRDDFDKYIEETEEKQRNILFPDAVRNSRSADAFFWHGSPNPPLVQRIAAWMFGLAFIGCGLMFSWVAAKEWDSDGWFIDTVLASISLSLTLVGVRVFRNGFPRKRLK